MANWEWAKPRNWWLKREAQPEFNPEQYFNRSRELIRYNFTDGSATYYENGVMLQPFEVEDAFHEDCHITDYYIDNSHMATPIEPDEVYEEEEQPEPPQTPEQVWAEITEMVEDNYGSGMSSLFNAMKGLIDELYVKNKDLETQIANLSERLDTMDYYNQAV